MKSTLLILGLTLGFKLQAQETTAIIPPKNFIISAFACIIANNETEFTKHLYDLEVLKSLVAKGRKLSEKESQRMEENFKIPYKDYTDAQTKLYQSIQSKIKELNINWQDIAFDSVSFTKSAGEFGGLDGSIYFKKKDNTEFYKANFKGLVKTQQRYAIETMYVPFVYIGAKNRMLTAAIKQQYLDSCISRTTEMLRTSKSELMKVAIGNCIPCTCSKQYVNDTEQTDGVERVKRKIKYQSKEVLKKGK